VRIEDAAERSVEDKKIQGKAEGMQKTAIRRMEKFKAWCKQEGFAYVTEIDADAFADSNEPAVNQQSDAESQPGDQKEHQTKRILGIIPNFRAVSVNEVLPAQSAKEKFITASEDTFDYSSLVLPVALAGHLMAINNTTEFH
jgi:hypothetical protein